MDGQCFPCHGTCLQCSGPSSSQCTACMNSTLHLGSCVDQCPQGTFAERGALDYCRPCPQSCAQCDSLEHCTECLGVLHLQDGQCRASCDDGYSFRFSTFWFAFDTCFSRYYSDRGVCVRCHGSCAACSGPLATDCTRCATGFTYLQQHCLSQCPLGHFNVSVGCLIADESRTPEKMSQFLCARCHASCGSCDGHSHNCTSCSESFTRVNDTCLLTAYL